MVTKAVKAKAEKVAPGASQKPERKPHPMKGVTSITPEMRETLLDLLSAGNNLKESAKAIGRSHDTVMRLVDADPSFAALYTRARAIGYAKLAEEILEISDEAEVQARHEGEDVRLALYATAIARNRLRVDTRKWLLSKVLPKIYGDKLDLNHGGEVKVTGIDIKFE
jgi:hypothetical protein